MSSIFRNYSFVFLLVSAAVFIACSKKQNSALPDNQGVNYGNSPSTPIPDEIEGGIWFWGNIGPIAYYDTDGHEVGNETEAANEYVFTEESGKGRYEFTQYLGMRNSSNCVTEIYTTKKGTVVFEDSDQLTLYPVEGSFRTVKTGCDAGTTVRPASPEDLKSQTYLWEIITYDGSPLLYLYELSDIEKQNPVFVYSCSSE